MTGVQALRSALVQSQSDNRRMQQAQQFMHEAQEALRGELNRVRETCRRSETNVAELERQKDALAASVRACAHTLANVHECWGGLPACLQRYVSALK